MFQLELGDAIITRNVGARVIDADLEDLDWISYLRAAKTPDAEWYELVVLHHTDGSSALMADDELRAGFTALGHDDATLLRALSPTRPGPSCRNCSSCSGTLR